MARPRLQAWWLDRFRAPHTWQQWTVNVLFGSLLTLYVVVGSETLLLLGLHLDPRAQDPVSASVYAVLASMIVAAPTAFLILVKWGTEGERVVALATVGILMVGALPLPPGLRMFLAALAYGLVAPIRWWAAMMLVPAMVLWTLKEWLTHPACHPDLGCPHDPGLLEGLVTGVGLLLVPAVIGAALGDAYVWLTRRAEDVAPPAPDTPKAAIPRNPSEPSDP